MAESKAIVIAVLGAESTGKTTLAQALAARVALETGLRCACVPEALREWCDAEGRTPRADEQAGIARLQQQRIHIAAARHDVVVADTTALMTAVYSRLYFNDDSLVPMAIAAQKSVALSLLTAIDIPWVADGHQRDGPQLRGHVDSALRDLLITHRLPWAWVAGVGDLRIARALEAVAPLLRARASR